MYFKILNNELLLNTKINKKKKSQHCSFESSIEFENCKYYWNICSIQHQMDVSILRKVRYT